VQLVEALKLFVVIYLSFYVGENRWSYFLEDCFGSNSQLAIDDVKICPTTSCSLDDFEDGAVLLVRRLLDDQIGEKNLKAEAAMLAKVEHRNLTIRRGGFIIQDVRLLL